MTQEENTPGTKPRRSYFHYGTFYPGIYLLLVGVIFLLNSFGYLQGHAWGKLWPLFIIIPALLMIFPLRRR